MDGPPDCALAFVVQPSLRDVLPEGNDKLEVGQTV